MRKIYSNQKTNHFKDENRTHSNLQNILCYFYSLYLGLLFQKNIEFGAEGLGLLDANACLSYFSKNVYNCAQLKLLKFYFLTTTQT